MSASQRQSIPKQEVIILDSDEEDEVPRVVHRFIPQEGVVDLTAESPPPSPRPAAAQPAQRNEVPRSSVPAKLESVPPLLQRKASPQKVSPQRAESSLRKSRASSSGQEKVSVQSMPSHVTSSSSKESQAERESFQPAIEAVMKEEQAPTFSQLVQSAADSVLEKALQASAADDNASEMILEAGNLDTQDGPQIRPQIKQVPPPASSVGTESPLLHRRRSQHGSEIPQQRASISDDELIEALRGFKETMEEDHRTTTYYKLHDAKIAIEDAPKSKFMDKRDPFASMKSVQIIGTQSQAPAGISYEKADYWTFKAGKFVKTKTMVLAATHFDDKVPRMPAYQSYTNVRRNVLSADDENLAYIPYLGDIKDDKHHDKLMLELEEAGARARDEDIQIYERAHKLRMWLISWLEILNLQALDMQTLKHYVVTLPGMKKRVQKASELKPLRKYSSHSLNSEALEIARRFCEAFEAVFDIDICKVVLPKEQLREMIDAALLRSVRSNRTTTARDALHRLSTYLELTCLICGVVDCTIHGEFTDRESSDEESSSPRLAQSSSRQKSKNEDEHFTQRQHSDVALTYEETLARYRSQKRTRVEPIPKNVKPCSDDCHLCADESRGEYELEKETIETIHDMMIAMDNPAYQACHIAFSLDIPCWQVRIECLTHIANSDYLIVNNPEPDSRAAAAKRPDWYDNRRRIIKGDLKDVTSAHLHETRLTSDSCRHEGPCGKQCPCTTRNILCERFCGCADDCPRKFTGCSCHANGLLCTTERCICIEMNRECGPECDACGAVKRINPEYKQKDALFTTGCQNVSLQRGVAKKILMGESQFGFGAFVVEPIRKGEFIGEYTGEVISSAEADRRGIIYDRKRMSFLFDLNASYAIDAAKMGNLTRFINHASSAEEGLNCEAKIVLVNGEHRIKFLATRDIAPGAELLFNYGRIFAEKHGLDVKIHNAKKVKGVVVSEEGLDALSGITPEKKTARGHLRAGRGRAKTGRKTATKSANPSSRSMRRKVDADGDLDMETEATSQETIAKRKGKAVVDDDEEDEDFEGAEEESSGSDSQSDGVSEDDDVEDPRSRSRRFARRSRMS